MGRFHAGSSALLDLVKARHPQALVCGHIHEDAGMTRVGETRIVNCAVNADNAGALLVFEHGCLTRLEML